MRIGKYYIFFIFLILISSVLALTPEERVYFDSQSQKELAQITAKIDGTKETLEKTMLSEFEDSTRYIEGELNKNMKNTLKSIAIGLAGFMILILALFRVIDLRLNRTRAIENYENKLKKDIEEVKKYKIALDLYRESLIKYNQSLSNSPKKLELKKEKKGKKKVLKVFVWILFAIVVIALIFISVMQLKSILGF